MVRQKTFFAREPVIVLGAVIVVARAGRRGGKVANVRARFVAVTIMGLTVSGVMDVRGKMLLAGTSTADGVQANMRPAKDKADDGEPGQSPGAS